MFRPLHNFEESGVASRGELHVVQQPFPFDPALGGMGFPGIDERLTFAVRVETDSEETIFLIDELLDNTFVLDNKVQPLVSLGWIH